MLFRKKVSLRSYCMSISDIVGSNIDENISRFSEVIDRRHKLAGYDVQVVSDAYASFIINNLIDDIDRQTKNAIIADIEESLKRADIHEQNYLTECYNQMSRMIEKSIAENDPQSRKEYVMYSSIAFADYFCLKAEGVSLTEAKDQLKYTELCFVPTHIARDIMQLNKSVKVNRDKAYEI